MNRAHTTQTPAPEPAAASPAPPADGGAYSVILWKDAGSHRRLDYSRPVDALISGIDYLRLGYHVCLNERAVAGLANDGTADAFAAVARRAAGTGGA